jgi:hypothetical protein
MAERPNIIQQKSHDGCKANRDDVGHYVMYKLSGNLRQSELESDREPTRDEVPAHLSEETVLGPSLAILPGPPPVPKKIVDGCQEDGDGQ